MSTTHTTDQLDDRLNDLQRNAFGELACAMESMLIDHLDPLKAHSHCKVAMKLIREMLALATPQTAGENHD